jgi:hypothetical protein
MTTTSVPSGSVPAPPWWSRPAFRALALAAAVAAASIPVAPGPAAGGGPPVLRGAEVGPPVIPGSFDGDLRLLPPAPARRPDEPIREVPKLQYPRAGAAPAVSAVAEREGSVAEGAREAAPAAAPREPDAAGRFAAPLLNIAGQGYTFVNPPDTVGDVGPNHYIQMVNHGSGSQVTVYTKAGAVLAGPFLLAGLWPPAVGGACASGHGDPIVLWDSLADRWLLSEFASTGNHLCVYVSKTADPVGGGFWVYDFPTPDFPDYPKYGVWPDAYYVSTNESSPAVYALDRARMLQGLVATSQRFTAPDLAGFPFQALTPADLDGATPPPPGAPGLFLRHRDDEVHNVGANNPAVDFVEVWEFHVDWATPANSTFTGPLNVAVTEFDSSLCGLVSFACFPQPGTATTLDPLREVVMWRLQYRNFASHQTLVGNFVTDVGGTDHGGVRWFELRKAGAGAWALQQEGTVVPDAHHRWMGSIAMDGQGNIALGYSVSSSTVFPSIRFTGRRAADPPGTMLAETELIAGTAANASNRWGDYSAMSVDPADDCTFWYTNMYSPASQWATRIGAFAFPSCREWPAVVTGAGPGGGPHVRTFTRAGAPALSFFPYGIAFAGGVHVALGDVGGDGVPDVVTGPGPGGGPHVRVFDGLTGAQLPGPIGSFFAYPAAFAGGVFVAAGDLTGDGRADVVTGAGPGGGPHVRAFDGLTGAQLPGPIGSFFAYPAAFAGGVSVAVARGGLLAEGFANIAALPGWVQINRSEPLGTIGWFQGNGGVFPAQDGVPNAYIAANFNNTAGVGTISNWLLTPVLLLRNGATFRFHTRTPDGSIWPDRLQVRLSTSGASTDVGAGAAGVGAFTTLLLDINPALAQGGYPVSWTEYTVTVTGLPGPATGRFAFRYFVTNAGPSGANSNYIGIDSVRVANVPAVVTGAGPGGGAHVQLISAATGLPLAGFLAYPVAFTGGVEVAAGDVNGDGVDDVITGAGPGGGPHVQVFDGAALRAGGLVLLHSFFAFAPAFAGGVHVGAAEVTGNARADIVVGAGPGGGPHLRTFDGATAGPVGGPLGSLFPYPAGFFGGVHVGGQ